MSEKNSKQTNQNRYRTKQKKNRRIIGNEQMALPDLSLDLRYLHLNLLEILCFTSCYLFLDFESGLDCLSRRREACGNCFRGTEAVMQFRGRTCHSKRLWCIL